MEVLWKETIQVNALRLLGAIIAWFVIMSLSGEDGSSAIAIPVVYIPIAVIAMVGQNFPGSFFFNFFRLMALITILPGDPLVFLLKLVFPQAVPMANYSILNFAYFLYVHS